MITCAYKFEQTFKVLFMLKRNRMSCRKVAAVNAAIAAAIIILEDSSGSEEEVEKPEKRVWVCDFLRKRDEEGFFAKLWSEIRCGDPLKFRNFLRMESTEFDTLLNIISPRISKRNVVREAISPAQRLTVTLRYLATGESFRSLSYLFRMSQSIISSIVPECCEAIYILLGPIYLNVSTQAVVCVIYEMM